MKNKQTESTSWKVEFNGVLSQSVRCSLIEELFKYILFQRGQTPTTFDLLKRPEHTENLEPGKKKVHDRKLENFIESIDLILATLREAFQNTDRIHEALVILGPTSVSPKEVYHLKLPPNAEYEGDYLARRKCVQSMVRQLVTDDIFRDCKELNATNIHVMVRCPSDLNAEHLQPKLNFEIPKRGHRFELEIGCTCDVLERIVEPEKPELGSNDTDAESMVKMLADCDISGVGLLDTTEEILDTPSYGATTDKENDVLGCRSDTELIWYRVNVNVKGCRGKPAECAGMGWC